MTPEMKQFGTDWATMYNKLYNGVIEENYDYVQMGLIFIRTCFNPLANNFVRARHDIMSSDREIEAFARTILDYLAKDYTMSQLNSIE